MSQANSFRWLRSGIVPKWEFNEDIVGRRCRSSEPPSCKTFAPKLGQKYAGAQGARASHLVKDHLWVLCTTVSLGFESVPPVGVAILIDTHLLFVRSGAPVPPLAAAVIM